MFPIFKSRPRNFSRGFAIAAWVVVTYFATSIGCGGGGPEVVPVRGVITYGGGAWPKPGVIYFNPTEAAEGLPLRPALGSFDVDGNVQVTSFQGRSGLVPGTYIVGLECWEVPPTMESDAKAVSYLPPDFQRAVTSGLTVEVKAGAPSVEIKFDVPKR